MGESARTGHKRGENHINDLLHRKEGKPLWVHSRDMHDSKLVGEDFKMKVVKRYKTPLQGQIGEALMIKRKGITSDILMNKKGEWNGGKIPRIRLESENGGEDKLRSQEENEAQVEKDRRKLLRKEWKKSVRIKRKCDDDEVREVTITGNDEAPRSKRMKVDNKEVKGPAGPKGTLNIVNFCRSEQAEEPVATAIEASEAGSGADSGPETSDEEQEAGAAGSVREVVSLSVSLSYLVEYSQIQEQIEVEQWPGEEILVEIAREMDRE